MLKQCIAKAGALQVLLERFPSMDGQHAFMLTPDIEMPLVPVTREGAEVVH